MPKPKLLKNSVFKSLKEKHPGLIIPIESATKLFRGKFPYKVTFDGDFVFYAGDPEAHQNLDMAVNILKAQGVSIGHHFQSTRMIYTDDLDAVIGLIGVAPHLLQKVEGPTCTENIKQIEELAGKVDVVLRQKLWFDQFSYRVDINCNGKQYNDWIQFLEDNRNGFETKNNWYPRRTPVDTDELRPIKVYFQKEHFEKYLRGYINIQFSEIITKITRCEKVQTHAKAKPRRRKTQVTSESSQRSESNSLS